jgi:hypothetical protein
MSHSKSEDVACLLRPTGSQTKKPFGLLSVHGLSSNRAKQDHDKIQENYSIAKSFHTFSRNIGIIFPAWIGVPILRASHSIPSATWPEKIPFNLGQRRKRSRKMQRSPKMRQSPDCAQYKMVSTTGRSTGVV